MVSITFCHLLQFVLLPFLGCMGKENVSLLGWYDQPIWREIYSLHTLKLTLVSHKAKCQLIAKIHSYHSHSHSHTFIPQSFIQPYIHTAMHSYHSHSYSHAFIPQSFIQPCIHTTVIHTAMHSYHSHSYSHAFIPQSFIQPYIHTTVIHTAIHSYHSHSYNHTFIPLLFHSGLLESLQRETCVLRRLHTCS